MPKEYVLTVEVREDGKPANHFQAGFTGDTNLIGGMGDLLDLFKLQGVEPALEFLYKAAEQMPGTTQTEVPL